MLKLLDIRFSFFLRSTYANADGKNPIIFRIVYRKQVRDIFTGLYCYKNDWVASLRKVSPNDPESGALNSNMELIQHRAMEEYDRLRFQKRDFAIGELIDNKGNYEPPQTLQEYLAIKKMVLKARLNVDITAGTLKKYNSCFQHLDDFIEKQTRSNNIALPAITPALINKLFHYLRIEKSISHNVAMNYMKCFKTVFSPAVKEGLIKNNPFEDFKMSFQIIHVDFLNDVEVETIANLPIKEKALARTRDQFIFCCYTGLAYVDLSLLNRKNFIIEVDGSIFIKIPRQKTNQISIIPLLPAALNILLDYSPTTSFKDFTWKVAANQKMNLQLKKLAKKAGITKKVHMHLARHTFATTVTLGNGVPIESVSKMLGHSSINMTQRYAKVLPAKIKNDMEQVAKIYNSDFGN